MLNQKEINLPPPIRLETLSSGAKFSLQENDYELLKHPALDDFPFILDQNHAWLFGIKRDDSTEWMLKTFKEDHRNVDTIRHWYWMLGGHEKLNPDLPGLDWVKDARILTEYDAEKFSLHPQTQPPHPGCDHLRYAILMPRVKGEVWGDILQDAKEAASSIFNELRGDKARLQLAKQRWRDVLLLPLTRVCAEFLSSMASWEKAGVVHGDLSAGNLFIEIQEGKVLSSTSRFKIRLVDLESVYCEGLPDRPHFGTPAYQHRSLAKQSRYASQPNGDRYSAAIIAAEILLLSDLDWTAEASDEGAIRVSYNFTRESPEGIYKQEALNRFAILSECLDRNWSSFFDGFEKTWNAISLEECSSLVDLSEVRMAKSLDLLRQTMDIQASNLYANSNFAASSTFNELFKALASELYNSTVPVSKPVSKPVATPVNKPVATPVSKPVSTPLSKTVTLPVNKPVATPVTKPVTKPVTTPLGNPLTTPVATPVATPASKPVTPAPGKKEPVDYEHLQRHGAWQTVAWIAAVIVILGGVLCYSLYNAGSKTVDDKQKSGVVRER